MAASAAAVGGAGRPGREAQVVGHGEVVVEEGGVAEQADPAADGAAVGPQVVAEHLGLAGRDADQPGAGPQQGGLAGAVRAPHQHAPRRGDVEVDARQGGEPAEERHRGTEADGEGHGDRLSGAGTVDRGHRDHGPRSPVTRTDWPSGGQVHGRDPASRPGHRQDAHRRPGVLILLFVAYQLWGTGLARGPGPGRPARTSSPASAPPTTSPRLATERDHAAADHRPPPWWATPSPTSSSPRPASTRSWSRASAWRTSRRRPATTPARRCRASPGNAAIAGHRTTYGAPFYDLDKLEPGDPITVTTRAGEFRYEVTERRSCRRRRSEVLDDTDDNRLTLTTCNPKYRRPSG